MGSATALPSPTMAQLEGSGQLLELIRHGKAVTVTQMAGAMGVARSTILQRLAYLEQWGFVQAEMHVLGGRGRPATVSSFAPASGVVLAAQIGLTGYRAALTDLAGDTLADRFESVEVSVGPAALIDAVIRTFESLLADAGADPDSLAGVGIGIPRTLELQSFARSRGGGVDWSSAAFREALHARFGVPTFIDLDVNLLALAEQRMSWPDAEVLVCLKLGTLIDSSVVVRGEPVRGADGLAGELGHIKVAGSDQLCTCGSIGCLEAVASGTALVRDLAAAGFEVSHVTDVLRLAADGVPEAMHAVREAGRRIGSAVALVVNLLNPIAVTAWGYLAESQLLFAGIRETLYGAALAGTTERLELVSTSLGDLAGVRGAALRVIDGVLAPAAIDQTILARSWKRAAAV
ncbi:MAG: ROK family protein [Cellulomonas sp.]|nr:ROK family protein [uncultured Microbacterium sp.]MBN9188559.1 ROK family protein [Microbacterium sp.]MBN9193812.1 ROK family protein [Microbacterium sp.]MBN9376206.1 ROK family protein [Cellulomonas sp.]